MGQGRGAGGGVRDGSKMEASMWRDMGTGTGGGRDGERTQHDRHNLAVRSLDGCYDARTVTFLERSGPNEIIFQHSSTMYDTRLKKFTTLLVVA